MQFLMVFFWLAVLMHSDSYYAPYLFVGLLGLICAIKKPSNKEKKKLNTLNIFSGTLSFCVALTNYGMYQNFFIKSLYFGEKISHVLATAVFIVILISGFYIFRNILSFLETFTLKFKSETKKKKIPIFLLVFLIIAIVDLILLFLVFYPGILTNDSFDITNQMLTNNYSNHHPVYFTIFARPFILLGKNIFGDLSAGLATYFVVQIFIIAGIYAFSIHTLYKDKRISKKIALILAGIIAILPYNFMYSITLWKDVLFSISILGEIVAFYRFFKMDETSKKLNLFLIILFGFAICLFRSNGMLVFAGAVLFFFIAFRKKYLKLSLALIGVLICSFILKHPVLSALNVKQHDNVEPLAIPMQQMTRVLVDNYDNIDEDDKKLISNVADPNGLRASYNPRLHDDVKYYVRRNGNKEYISEHMAEFIGLYMKWGIKYPNSYVTAWTDQTRGYWGGGYLWFRWTDYENDYTGREPEVRGNTVSQKLKQATKAYLDIFDNFEILRIFESIGLFTWALLALLYVAIKRKAKEHIFLILFPLLNLGTLLIATPVFADLRYAYSLFTCMPFLLVLTFTKSKKEKQ